MMMTVISTRLASLLPRPFLDISSSSHRHAWSERRPSRRHALWPGLVITFLACTHLLVRARLDVRPGQHLALPRISSSRARRNVTGLLVVLGAGQVSSSHGFPRSSQEGPTCCCDAFGTPSPAVVAARPRRGLWLKLATAASGCLPGRAVVLYCNTIVIPLTAVNIILSTIFRPSSLPVPRPRSPPSRQPPLLSHASLLPTRFPVIPCLSGSTETVTAIAFLV